MSSMRPPGYPQPMPPQRAGSNTARGIAELVRALAWVGVIGDIAGGIYLAMEHTDICVGDACARDYPYRGEGITLAVGGTFTMLVVIMFASYIIWRIEQVQG